MIDKIKGVRDMEDFQELLDNLLEGCDEGIKEELDRAYKDVYDKSLGCLALREVYGEDGSKYGYVIKIESQVSEWVNNYLDDKDIGYYFKDFEYEYKGYNQLINQRRDYEVYLVFLDKKGSRVGLGIAGFKFKGFNKKEYHMLLDRYLGGLD